MFESATKKGADQQVPCSLANLLGPTADQQENARIEAELAEREAEAERQRIAEERAAAAARLAEEERARKAEEAALARERAGAQVRGRGRGRGWGGTTTGIRGGRGTGMSCKRCFRRRKNHQIDWVISGDGEQRRYERHARSMELA